VIFGLLGGLLGGLGKIGTVARTVGAAGKYGKLAGIGRIALTLGRLRAGNIAAGNQLAYSNIVGENERMRAGVQSGNMMRAGIELYGRALESGARAGGVMPNYYGSVLNGIADNWREYGNDLHTAEYNAVNREYRYRALRAANSMQLYGVAADYMMDLYGSARRTAQRTAEHTIL
jgi:hypothetical protein